MYQDILMVSGTSDGMYQAVEAFRGCIPFAQLPWDRHPQSDRVAVWHLFLSLPTTLPSLYIL